MAKSRTAPCGRQAMSAPDGMIAVIAKINGGRLATRNLADFETTGLDLDVLSALIEA